MGASVTTFTAGGYYTDGHEIFHCEYATAAEAHLRSCFLTEQETDLIVITDQSHPYRAYTMTPSQLTALDVPHIAGTVCELDVDGRWHHACIRSITVHQLEVYYLRDTRDGCISLPLMTPNLAPTGTHLHTAPPAWLTEPPAKPMWPAVALGVGAIALASVPVMKKLWAPTGVVNTPVSGDAVCNICMDRVKAIVFGCGHANCEECARRLAICAQCRTPITRRQRLFL